MDDLTVLSEEASISASVSVPENLNEIEMTENSNVIDESVNSNDTETGFDCPDEWKESDLWKQTKPITVIKDISKKIKARRASERRRYISFRTYFFVLDIHTN